MKIYITFGQTHTHSINGKTFDKDVIAEIDCETYEDGRNKAFDYFDGIFATSYDEFQVKDILHHFPKGIVNVK